MNKKMLVLVCMMILSITIIAGQVAEDSGSSTPLTFDMSINNNKIIVGGDDINFKPEAYLSKWDDEVFIKVEYPTTKTIEPIIKDNKIKWIDTDKEIHFYPLEKKTYEEDGQQVTMNEEGGFEYEIILKTKPETNVITLNIETENLDFYYQPPLHKEQHEPEVFNCIETACYDEDGNVRIFRPENVVGSYAVYHSSKSDNKYKAGKAFHIYRPKIIDSLGNEIWGELTISNGLLTITIDQDWLDKATYPVIVDPTFGYETAGGSDANYYDYVMGTSYTSGGTGTITSMTAYVKQGTGGQVGRYVIYNSGGTTAIDWTAEHEPDGYWSWDEVSTTQSGSVSDSTEYFLAMWLDGMWFAYDSGVSGGYTSSTYSSSNDPPTPVTTDNWANHKISIYCTYTEGGDETPPTFTTSPYNKTTTNESAEISWTTNENANYTLTIGLCPSFTGINSFSNATSTTTHDKWVDNLQNSTNYCVNVTATDASDNSASDNVSFTTAANIAEEYANEEEGDTAIQLGIESSEIWTATVYDSYQVSGANTTNQFSGRFDKFAIKGNKRWAINYVSAGESAITGIFSITPTLYVLQLEDLSSEAITDQVGDLINNTYP